MAESPIDGILTSASSALNPSPDVSGCPDSVAMLAAPAVLRATAAALVGLHDLASLQLYRWADEIDDKAAIDTEPNPRPRRVREHTAGCAWGACGDPPGTDCACWCHGVVSRD